MTELISASRSALKEGDSPKLRVEQVREWVWGGGALASAFDALVFQPLQAFHSGNTSFNSGRSPIPILSAHANDGFRQMF
ncbi:hypothetical protein [Paenibacillus sp. FSL H7-0331]|uniref:hypothetical protein n=1 Tax=Paenibacillus sp. FSL H7-0331 TaxID=1920421 RepID=UPI001180244E|nr:hypothetical protein [Paenibacillus sp. FSL H7-0331]